MWAATKRLTYFATNNATTLARVSSLSAAAAFSHSNFVVAEAKTYNTQTQHSFLANGACYASIRYRIPFEGTAKEPKPAAVHHDSAHKCSLPNRHMSLSSLHCKQLAEAVVWERS